MLYRKQIVYSSPQIQLECAIGLIWLDKRVLAVDKLSANLQDLSCLPKSPALLDRARNQDMLIIDKEPL